MKICKIFCITACFDQLLISDEPNSLDQYTERRTAHLHPKPFLRIDARGVLGKI